MNFFRGIPQKWPGGGGGRGEAPWAAIKPLFRRTGDDLSPFFLCWFSSHFFSFVFDVSFTLDRNYRVPIRCGVAGKWLYNLARFGNVSVLNGIV